MLLATPATAAWVWGTYGFVRALGAPGILYAMSGTRPERVIDRLALSRPSAWRVTGGLLVSVSAATLVAAVPDAVGTGRPRSAIPVRSCASAAERPRTGPTDLVTGPFAFLDLPSIARSKIGRTYMWKTPVWLAHGRRVRLSVASRDRGTARLIFTPPSNRRFAGGDTAVRFRACRSGPGTAFSGSLLTRRRALCMRLELLDESSGRRWRMALPLRHAC